MGKVRFPCICWRPLGQPGMIELVRLCGWRSVATDSSIPRLINKRSALLARGLGELEKRRGLGLADLAVELSFP